jgi:serine phosphatase RsbU (regulator of sigma subunit)
MSGVAGVELRDILRTRSALDLLEDYCRVRRLRVSLVDPDGRVVGGFGDDAGSSALSLPIRVFDREVGTLRVEAEEPDEDLAPVVEKIAGFLGTLGDWEYERDSLTQEILDSYEGMTCFYDIASCLGAVKDVEGICEVILDKACALIPVRRSSILLQDPSSGELYVASAKGIDPGERRAIRMRVGEGISGQVLYTGEPRLVEDVGKLPRGLLRGYEKYTSRSFLSVPLTVRSEDGPRTIGVLNMTDKLPPREVHGSAVILSHDVFRSKDQKLLMALADQAAVLIDNLRLISYEKEMGIARTIQQSLLPPEPPTAPGVRITGTCLTARNVGGDYFDYFRIGEENLGIVVADVSGHDVASALMMAVARSTLRREIRREGRPGRALEAANGSLLEDLERTELFISAFLAVYHVPTGRLRYASAGHNPPYLLRRGTAQVEELDADGMLLGVLPGVAFEEAEMRLGQGDVLLLYTDGLVEAADPSGRHFGTARLAATLCAEGGSGAVRCLDGVLKTVREHCARRPTTDDITTVVLEVTDEPGGEEAAP